MDKPVFPGKSKDAGTGSRGLKRIGIIAGIIMAVIIIGILLISGAEKETDVTKEKTKVGLILNDSCMDRTWGQSHYEGLLQSAQDLNLEIIYEENVPEDAACMGVMENMIEEGCRIIICDSLNYGDWELQMAQKYPEVYFLHAGGTQYAKNMSSYFGRIYQMRYLSGIVAGLQTKTNEIGYVAAYPVSEVNRGINAFTLGVRSVNEEATVYVEWSDTWTEDDQTEEATERLLAGHNIDVLAMHTNSLRVLEIAEESGIWSIGYHLDNAELFPNTFLTAPVWNWSCFYEQVIMECLQEKFVGKNYWEGVEDGLVELSPFTSHVVAGAAEKVEEAREQLEEGSYDVFYGPIYDQDGVLRVEAGENMSDAVLLNAFDWYVEGVVICEEE